MSASFTADQQAAVDHVEVLIRRYYEKNYPTLLAAAAREHSQPMRGDA